MLNWFEDRQNRCAEIKLRAGRRAGEPLAEDVSFGGMLVKTEKTFPENEEIEVFFTIPGLSQGIQARVRVARLGPGSLIGLEFLNLSPESEKVIQQYLAAQSAP